MANKAIQCKAAVVWKANDPIKIETVEIAPPKPNEVRVKISHVGICQSDVGCQKAQIALMKFPCILGHEGSGVVESVGDGVTRFKPGDHVLTLWNFRCGKCRSCQNPKTNVCDLIGPFLLNYGFDGTELQRVTQNGTRLHQALGVGAFSEYIVVHELAVLKINPKMPLNKASLFACCVPTGYGAAKYAAKVQPGAIVAVWGLGAVGLCVVLGCQAANAKKIIGIDVNASKFDIGKKFGCTDFINPLDLKKPIKETIHEMTGGGLAGGGGVDYAFICVGKEQVMEDAVECTHVNCGETVIIGVPESARNISVNPTALLMGRVVKGSWGGGCMPDDMCHLVNLHQEGKLPMEDLITHNIKLDAINDGFKMLEEGKSIRTVVEL